MAILHSCCWRKSLRTGSFLSGFFSLTFYTLILTASLFNMYIKHLPDSSQKSFKNLILLGVFNLFSTICAGLCVISSVLLLVGLCVDNRLMLLPWIFSVSITTLLDVILSFYFFTEIEIDSFLAILFVIDTTICALNIYSILCVISQYQEYQAGRGRAGQFHISQQPVVQYYTTPICDTRPRVSIKVSENDSNSDSQMAPPSNHQVLIINKEAEEQDTGLWVSNGNANSTLRVTACAAPWCHEKELSDNEPGTSVLCNEIEPLLKICKGNRLPFQNISEDRRTTKTSSVEKTVKTSNSFTSSNCLNEYSGFL
ncbi:uncharacterized protein [Centruroides vittatus]|uniref:uncharacterized protein isoform X1 n=1 Tax=Centruroides vittatus TaxID=120091 RepID=UPI00350EF530